MRMHDNSKYIYGLQINNVCKAYNNDEKVLKGIELNLQNGDFYCLLGPNGAGKTTLLEILAGRASYDSGEITLNNYDSNFQKHQYRKMISYSSDKINDAIQRLMIECQLLDYKDAIAQNLSGGYKRRLQIAISLIKQSDLIILDEPTAGLDYETRISWHYGQWSDQLRLKLLRNYSNK
ncbi:abc transporter [Stylonychia lemnae]|uniref:Abc transporter n=1 Tax=Stylonychia lemnae TaxID=5949 RepID=A0A077ZQI0_STYLE|nr:abc transporter [Stylonychia lemnae]|eukprot:CDW71714.1 abc transporter [Stylonychia lemnae]